MQAVIVAAQPKEPQDQLLEELSRFIKRKTPLRVNEVILAKAPWENLNATTIMRMMVRRYHAYSDRAPIWLREFACCIAKAGGTFNRDPQPMPIDEQAVVLRSYNDNISKPAGKTWCRASTLPRRRIRVKSSS